MGSGHGDAANVPAEAGSLLCLCRDDGAAMLCLVWSSLLLRPVFLPDRKPRDSWGHVLPILVLPDDRNNGGLFSNMEHPI